MVIFHSYVSLPEGTQKPIETLVPNLWTELSDPNRSDGCTICVGPGCRVDIFIHQLGVVQRQAHLKCHLLGKGNMFNENTRNLSYVCFNKSHLIIGKESTYYLPKLL
jgi:hypothetical protein